MRGSPRQTVRPSLAGALAVVDVVVPTVRLARAVEVVLPGGSTPTPRQDEHRYDDHHAQGHDRVTVTRRKVAGIDVASALVFCSLKRASSSAWSSSSRPLAEAASKAFMVGP